MDSLQGQVCELLSSGHTLSSACEEVGIPKYAYWRRYIQPLVGKFESHKKTIERAAGPYRISYVSPRIKWEEETPRPWTISDGENIEHLTAYEHRRTVPAHFNKWFREAKHGDCILWDGKPDPVENPIRYREAVRGCVKSIYWTERSKFSKYAIFDGGERVGCESLEDAEAEAWIYCLSENIFGQAEQKQNPDAYVWEAIKNKFMRASRQGNNSVTIDGKTVKVTGFATINSKSDGEDYAHTLSGIEARLVNKAIGRTPQRRPHN